MSAPSRLHYGYGDSLSGRPSHMPELTLERVPHVNLGSGGFKGDSGGSSTSSPHLGELEPAYASLLSSSWRAVACAWDPLDASVALVAEASGAVRTMRVGPTGAATIALFALTRRRMLDRGKAAYAEPSTAVIVEPTTQDESFAWGNVPARPWAQLAYLPSASHAASSKSAPVVFYQAGSNKLLLATLPAGVDARASALENEKSWSTVYCFARHPFRLTGFAVSPAASRVATSCEDGSIRVYRTSDAVHVASAPTSIVPLPAGGLRPACTTCLAFAGERAFVAGTEGGAMRLWALPSDTTQTAQPDAFAMAWGAHAGDRASAALAPPPQLNQGTSAPHPVEGRPNCAALASFLDDASVGAISCVAAFEGDSDSAAHVARADSRAADGSLLAALRHGERAPAVAAGACRLVAAGTSGGILHAWMFLPPSAGKTPLVSEAKWKQVCVAHQARGHGLTSVAFAPSGSALAAASPSGGGCHGGVVRLYDTRSWRVARAYDVTSAVVSASFRIISTSSSSGFANSLSTAMPWSAPAQRKADHSDTLLVCGQTSRPRLVEGARLMCPALSEQPGWARDGGVFALNEDGYSLEFAQTRFEQLEVEDASGAMDTYDLRSPAPPRSRSRMHRDDNEDEEEDEDEGDDGDDGDDEVAEEEDGEETHEVTQMVKGTPSQRSSAATAAARGTRDLPFMPRLAAMRGMSAEQATAIHEETRAAAAQLLTPPRTKPPSVPKSAKPAHAAHDHSAEMHGLPRSSNAPATAMETEDVTYVAAAAATAEEEEEVNPPLVRTTSADSTAPRGAPPPAPMSRASVSGGKRKSSAPRPRAALPPTPAAAVHPPRRAAASEAGAALAEPAPGAATAALARRVAHAEAALRNEAPRAPSAPSEEMIRAAATAATTRRRAEMAYDSTALPAIADPTDCPVSKPKVISKQLHPRWTAKYVAQSAPRAPRLRDANLYGRSTRSPVVNTCEAAPIAPPPAGSAGIADAARTMLLGM